MTKGGEIAVSNGENGEILVVASGENAGLRECAGEALALDMLPDELEPKYVHPYATGLIARYYGFKVSSSPTEGSLTLQILSSQA